ncbi:hypothetical protein D3C73_1320580 [compost metagenome]
MDLLAQLLDKLIDIIPPPVCFAYNRFGIVCLERRIIGKGHSGRVKIIVQMHSVNIVAFDYLNYGINNMLARFRDTRIYVQFAVSLDDPLRVKLGDMVCSQ